MHFSAHFLYGEPNFTAGKSHALHKRVEQLCTRAINWGELRRKTKVCVLKILLFFIIRVFCRYILVYYSGRCTMHSAKIVVRVN